MNWFSFKVATGLVPLGISALHRVRYFSGGSDACAAALLAFYDESRISQSL
jgi:hypothetical protein